MEIKRAGSQPSGKGPADWFTGTVRIDPLLQRRIPRACRARASPSSPARAPHAYASIGADADCHGRLRSGTALGRPDRRDPAGRRGVVRSRGKTLARRCAATAMTHIAIQEKLDGKVVDWMEHVSDEQYLG